MGCGLWRTAGLGSSPAILFHDLIPVFASGLGSGYIEVRSPPSEVSDGDGRLRQGLL
jgi:hypothetical protein